MITPTKQAVPAVWVYTTKGAYNAQFGGDLGFLTAEQRARLERIRQARLLFAGGASHRQYFLDEGRTQFDFPPVLVNDKEINLFVPLNVLKLISLKSADLLFGEEPLLRMDDDVQQASLSEFAERTSFHQRIYNAAVECSYEAESFIEVCVKDGQTYARTLDAADVFPLGSIGVDGQYERYVWMQLAQISGTSQNPIMGLLATTFAPGVITRELWQLDDKGNKRAQLTLDNWPAADGAEPLQPKTTTGIAINTLTWIPNALDHGRAVSDYDGLIELQDELNAKQTQMARVLSKHSDPKMWFPQAIVGEDGNVRASHDAFFGNTKDQAPFYIVWNAELAHASADRDFSLRMLCITAETSPVLLGLKEGAAPDAYRKLRLEAQNSLSKAKRKAANWKPGIRRVLTVAQALENLLPGQLGYAVNSVGVEMRDGLGVDELDQANTISVLRAAGVMSIRRAVEVQLTDPAAVEKELGELEEERAAATPSVLLQPGAPGTGGEPGEIPVTDAGDATAADETKGAAA